MEYDSTNTIFEIFDTIRNDELGDTDIFKIIKEYTGDFNEEITDIFRIYPYLFTYTNIFMFPQSMFQQN